MKAFDGAIATITIAEHSSKLTKNGATLIKLIDKDGRKYSFFSTKMDGNPTKAYQNFQNLGDPVGKTVEIGYSEDQAEFEGKPFTRRSIRFLKEIAQNEMNANGTYKPGTVTDIDQTGTPF